MIPSKIFGSIVLLVLATMPSVSQGGAVVVNMKAHSSSTFTTLAAARAHIISVMEPAGLGATGVTPPRAHVKIGPGRYYEALQLDHPALSGVHWEGVPAEDGSLPIISGGVEVPVSLFERWAGHENIMTARLSDINGSDLDLGGMVSGNAVSECQHDKVGLTLNGEPMVVARWPNINLDDPNTGPDGWEWTHANVNDDGIEHAGFKTMSNVSDPDAARLLRWREEANPWIHIYAEWDWADAYARVTHIREGADGFVHVDYDGAPDCKPNARWMGVNLLCELDAPGEYFIDEPSQTLYLYPPMPLDAAKDVVVLGYQPGAVINVTVENATLSNLDVREGRHAGIHANAGANGVVIENVAVHAHGTHGIVLTNATNAVVRFSSVYDVGCSGIRATGGVTATLEKGGMVIEGNAVSRHATWKRTYQPGIFWAGVSNTFRNNSISVAPHNCILGGGDFGEEFGGVDTVFEGNTMADCTFETTDSGGFYTCGQGGYAFLNRGNVLRNNTFLRVKNTAGLGVQVASNQAIYFDDQMSDWLVTGNTFVECQVGTFTGGGRRNRITNNTYRNCGTAHYLNNQGMNWDNSTVYPQCDEVAPPGYDEGETVCSTGAATWMATEGPAAAQWAAQWPEMLNISIDYPGEPAYSFFSNNSFCGSLDGESYMLGCPDGMDALCEHEAERWQFTISSNTYMEQCP